MADTKSVERARLAIRAFALLNYLVSLGYDDLQYEVILEGLEYINSMPIKDLENDWVKGR